MTLASGGPVAGVGFIVGGGPESGGPVGGGPYVGLTIEYESDTAGFIGGGATPEEHNVCRIK